MAGTTPHERGSTGNLFLDSLTSGGRIHDLLEHLEPEQGTPAGRSGAAIDDVFFPTSGVISHVVPMHDGSSVECSLVGREGFFGLPVAMGVAESVGDAMFQIPGGTLKIGRSDFVECLREDAELAARSLRFVTFSLGAISQFSGCNRLHTIGARLARWLLMAHDRVEGEQVALTQEYLATMLGVRRQGVTLAASMLEKAGLITYRRGLIVVIDRAGLEAAACECYGTINDLLERLMQYRLRKASDGTRSSPKP